MSEFTDYLESVLPMSSHKHIKAIDQEHSYYLDPILSVDVGTNPRVAVQTIEAYGILIELDASGNATRVIFPEGNEGHPA